MHVLTLATARRVGAGPLRLLTNAFVREPSALFCDIDGTISPIADSPETATVLPGAKAALERLSARLDLVCLLTGRRADEAWRMVGVDRAVYAGDHGAEIWRQGQLLRPPGIERYDGRLARARSALRIALADVPGLVFEDKGVAFAIHYRKEPAAASVVAETAERVATSYGLEAVERTAHTEVRSPIDVDKGRALRELAERHALKGLVVIGDDPVDEPAFEAARAYARSSGASLVTVTVGERLGGSADVSVPDPATLADLLVAVAAAVAP